MPACLVAGCIMLCNFLYYWFVLHSWSDSNNIVIFYISALRTISQTYCLGGGAVAGWVEKRTSAGVNLRRKWRWIDSVTFVGPKSRVLVLFSVNIIKGVRFPDGVGDWGSFKFANCCRFVLFLVCQAKLTLDLPSKTELSIGSARKLLPRRFC